MKDTDFGNGRAVRNLFGEMKMRLARRLMENVGNGAGTEAFDKPTLTTFLAEDVPIRQDSYVSPFSASFAQNASLHEHHVGGCTILCVNEGRTFVE
jgi:hypothetical protein